MEGVTRKTRRDSKTAEDEKRVEIIKEIGCICCLMEGLGKRYCEWDHLTISGFTQGHNFSIGICPWHHRGICEEDMTSSMMLAKYGPSKAKGSKTFHQKYGYQEFLLGYQNKLIEDYINGH